MNEKVLDLLLFLKELEFHVYFLNSELDKIIVFIPFYQLDEFTEYFPETTFDDGGIDVNLQRECIALDIKDMLEMSFEDEEVAYIVKKLKDWE